MLPIPTKFTIITGRGEGETRLNAFDAALLNAGLGNVNLLKVSSILPPGACETETLALQPGALVPVAYGTLASDAPGTTIAAAAAVGFGDEFGVIMEYSGFGSRTQAEARIHDMVREAFRMRSMPLRGIRIKAIEHAVAHIGSVFAGVVLWY